MFRLIKEQPYSLRQTTTTKISEKLISAGATAVLL